MTLSEKVAELEQQNEKLTEALYYLRQLKGYDQKPMMCQDCKMFYQHYVKCGHQYIKVNDGHCIAGKRCKKKRSEDECCRFFEKQMAE